MKKIFLSLLLLAMLLPLGFVVTGCGGVQQLPAFTIHVRDDGFVTWQSVGAREYWVVLNGNKEEIIGSGGHAGAGMSIELDLVPNQINNISITAKSPHGDNYDRTASTTIDLRPAAPTFELPNGTYVVSHAFITTTNAPFENFTNHRMDTKQDMEFILGAIAGQTLQIATELPSLTRQSLAADVFEDTAQFVIQGNNFTQTQLVSGIRRTVFTANLDVQNDNDGYIFLTNIELNPDINITGFDPNPKRVRNGEIHHYPNILTLGQSGVTIQIIAVFTRR